MRMDRQRAVQLAQETLDILEAGFYITSAGEVVEIAEAVVRAVTATRSYPPNLEVALPEGGRAETAIDVANQTTLAAAREEP